MNKSMKVRWTGKGREEKSIQNLVGTPEGKRPQGRVWRARTVL
jgi:hypothetical protein